MGTITPSGAGGGGSAGGAPHKQPRPKRVVFLLEGPRRFPDFPSQVLWMRLDGLTIDKIAKATRRDTETVQLVIDMWQRQVELREGNTFTPRARNNRRWGKRRKQQGDQEDDSDRPGDGAGDP